MDLEYEYKLGEMQKYIPFLERMIARLEAANSTSSQPRKAQLEKMITLRDLLMNKKKRMKMENLLKCEQVLSNLYAKVEQNDTLPGIIKASENTSDTNISKNCDDLNTLEDVRNKLKSAMTKTHEEIKKTLPDIEISSDLYNNPQSSKEPALFQRRPGLEQTKEEKSLSKNTLSHLYYKSSKREKSESKTLKQGYSRSGNNLYTRRSETDVVKSNSKMNFNFSIPKDKLSSLNTNDILNRIIDCKDGDNEITILRQLRTQILGELNKYDSGNSLFKALNSNKGKNVDASKTEVEEGELPDSDSEGTDNLSGKIVILKDTSAESNESKHVDICLVVDNKQKDGQISAEDTDFSDFEMNEDNDSDNLTEKDINSKNQLQNSKNNHIEIDNGVCTQENIKMQEKANMQENAMMQESAKMHERATVQEHLKIQDDVNTQDNEKDQNYVNFQKNLRVQNIATISKPSSSHDFPRVSKNKRKALQKESLLEIDILNALKKEILDDGNISLPIPEKAIVQDNSKDINIVSSNSDSKRRISLEKYKQNSSQKPCPNRSNLIQLTTPISSVARKNDSNINLYRNPDSFTKMATTNIHSKKTDNSLVKSVGDVEKMLSKLCPDLINSLMPVPDMVSQNYGSPKHEAQNSNFANQYNSTELQQHNSHVLLPIQTLNGFPIASHQENKQMNDRSSWVGQTNSQSPTNAAFFSQSEHQFTSKGAFQSTQSSLTGFKKHQQNIPPSHNNHSYNHVDIFNPMKSGQIKQRWRPQDPRLNRHTNSTSTNTASMSSKTLENETLLNQRNVSIDNSTEPKISNVPNLKNTNIEPDSSSDCNSKATKTNKSPFPKILDAKKIKLPNKFLSTRSDKSKKKDQKKHNLVLKKALVSSSNLTLNSSIKQFKIPKIKRKPEVIKKDSLEDDQQQDNVKETSKTAQKVTPKEIEKITSFKIKKKKRIIVPSSDSDDDFESASSKTLLKNANKIKDKKVENQESNVNSNNSQSCDLITRGNNRNSSEVLDKITCSNKDDGTDLENVSTTPVKENETKLINTMPVPDSTSVENTKDLVKEQKDAEKYIKDTDVLISSPKLNVESKPSSLKKDIDVDSILSILQDKSKIMELLQKLKGQPFENQKLKKQLERLSQLSDDDDDDESGKDNELEHKVKHNEEDNNSAIAANETNDKKIESCVKTKKKQVKKRKLPIRQNTNKAISKKNIKRLEYEDLLELLNSAKGNRPCRELKNLENDIKEMMSSNPTTTKNKKEAEKKCIKEPIVVLERITLPEKISGKLITKKVQTCPKSKIKKDFDECSPLARLKNTKPGPKSKTQKNNEQVMTLISVKSKKKDLPPKLKNSDKDSPITTKDKKPHQKHKVNVDKSETMSIDSDSEVELSESVKVPEIKKNKKRRKGKWESGILKTNKNKKAKIEEPKNAEKVTSSGCVETDNHLKLFTDVKYCFFKNDPISCRLCSYFGDDITRHHKQMHGDYEVPFSRLNPEAAQYAKTQCELIDLNKINDIPNEGFVCRFCDKEFDQQTLPVSFFWHIVNAHTGEYLLDSLNNSKPTNGSFVLDIPSPPKQANEQLTGYLCGKCNYTQVSLENVKNHVLCRHNDEETVVYHITMSVLSNKTVNALSNTVAMKLETSITNDTNEGNLSLTEADLNRQLIEKPQILFEESNDIELSTVKKENIIDLNVHKGQLQSEELLKVEAPGSPESEKTEIPDDEEDKFKVNYLDPQFKITFTETNAKQYICSVDERDHFKTSLLIAMKRHVAKNHLRAWDGYCSVCKVIVMPQGRFSFNDCLEHYTDKHSSPIVINTAGIISNESIQDEGENFEKSQGVELLPKISSVVSLSLNADAVPKTRPLISIRPLSELMPKTTPEPGPESYPLSLPVIKNVISLDSNSVISGDNAPIAEIQTPQKTIEESIEEIMSNKNRLILDAMMVKEKTVQIFKCAGSFCSFTSDSAENSLIHVSKHKSSEHFDALVCAYCKFDPNSNVIDLVSHVFKKHGHCEFVCSLCFYRAVASQLVAAHITRKHSDSAGTVLHSLFFTTPETSDLERLSRQVAVPHYACYGNGSPICTFRTYTAGKFFEHMQKNHQIGPYTCYICMENESSPSELVQHMRIHGLKLYQCTWCVYGGDNEKELLAHASESHPELQPEAYLRIIINKGVSNFKVLPLAHFNKSQISFQVEKVKTTEKDDPLKEVERSSELQKLIAQSSAPIGTANPVITENPPIHINDTIVTHLQEKSQVKVSEVIDLVVDTDLKGQFDYTCPKCQENFHRVIFRKHIKDCYSGNSGVFPCPYCPFIGSHKEVVDHVSMVDTSHFKRTDLYDSSSLHYICAVCTQREMTNDQIVYHYEQVHGVKHTIIFFTEIWKSGRPFVTITPMAESRKNVELDRILKSKLYDKALWRFVCGHCGHGDKVMKRVEAHVKRNHNVTETMTFSNITTEEKKLQYIVFGKNSKAVEPPAKKMKIDDDIVVVDDDHDTPEVVRTSTYPKFVPSESRYSCGVVGCGFIAKYLNDFRVHWQEEHRGLKFTCRHCPWDQNTCNIYTVRRMLDHLQMHGPMLFTCGLCNSYHYRRAILEKHFLDKHSMITPVAINVVREEVVSDWQCGLCKFQSHTVRDISNHSKLMHNIDKQYRCGNCFFSDHKFESIKSHHQTSHEYAEETIFYNFYKVGTVSNELDGIPRWMRQQEMISQIESMAAVDSITSGNAEALSVDTNIEASGLSLEELCKKYVEIRDPSEGQYMCPFCEQKYDENSEPEFLMHLHEELNYRRWSCSVCSYKAYHKLRQETHMMHEHGQIRQHHLLPVDNDIESWISHLLKHQTFVMKKYKEKQAITEVNSEASTSEDQSKAIDKKLCFGDYGLPIDNKYCCPKCEATFVQKDSLASHLHKELINIKWRCSSCQETFRGFHEVHEHVRVVHPGQEAYPVEMERSKHARDAWIHAVVEEQMALIKTNSKYSDLPETLG